MFLHNRSPAGTVLTSEKQIPFFLFCTCINKQILVCPKLAKLNYNNTLNKSHTSRSFLSLRTLHSFLSPAPFALLEVKKKNKKKYLFLTSKWS